MVVKKFESYSEDEGILADIFSGLEDSFNISVEVKKIFLSLKWHGPVWDGWSGNPSFYDILKERQLGYHKNISRLLPDSELIEIQRRASVGHAYRNIPFYTVGITYEEGMWGEDPGEFSNLAAEFGFLQIYDSICKFKRGKYIKQVLVFYHENYVGF